MKTLQIIILVIIVIVLPLSIFAEESNVGFKVGAAKIDITPDQSGGGARGGMMGGRGGFGFMGRGGMMGGGGASGGYPGAEGILDHIYARAIVIDNGTTRAALVSVDTGMVSDQVWRPLSQRIEQELSIPAQNLMINPVHTHQCY